VKKTVAVAAILVALTGCAFTHMTKGLQALSGHGIQTAFSVLGYPDAKQEYGGDTVYIWSTNRSGVLFLPQTSATQGYVGITPVYGMTTYNQAVPINYKCTIKIVADSNGMIKYCEWGGNEGGCRSYASRLSRYYKSLEK